MFKTIFSDEFKEILNKSTGKGGNVLFLHACGALLTVPNSKELVIEFATKYV